MSLLRLLSSALLLCATALPASAQLDNLGREFYCGFLPNPIDGPPFVELHLTAPVATSVTVDYPAIAPTFTTTVNLTPGAVTIVSLPSSASTGWTVNTPQSNVVRCTAADEFVCYMINRLTFTSDAALALPVDVLNRDYIVTDYNPAAGPSQFVVVAPFDNTTVTIVPSVALQGHPAGVPFDVVLDRGEGYMAFSQSTSGPAGSLTGTLVSADRPIGVTNGSFCVQVPTGTTACDHVFEVAQPVQSWGFDALAQNLPNRPGGTIYRITAS